MLSGSILASKPCTKPSSLLRRYTISSSTDYTAGKKARALVPSKAACNICKWLFKEECLAMFKCPLLKASCIECSWMQTGIDRKAAMLLCTFEEENALHHAGGGCASRGCSAMVLTSLFWDAHRFCEQCQDYRWGHTFRRPEIKHHSLSQYSGQEDQSSEGRRPKPRWGSHQRRLERCDRCQGIKWRIQLTTELIHGSLHVEADNPQKQRQRTKANCQLHSS